MCFLGRWAVTVGLLELSVCFGDEFLVGIFVLKFFFPILKVLFLSFRVSFAVKVLLRLMTSLRPILIFFTLKIWIQKELAVIYNKAFSAYIFLKGFRVSILTLRSVNYLEFFCVYLLL